MSLIYSDKLRIFRLSSNAEFCFELHNNLVSAAVDFISTIVQNFLANLTRLICLVEKDYFFNLDPRFLDLDFNLEPRSLDKCFRFCGLDSHYAASSS